MEIKINDEIVQFLDECVDEWKNTVFGFGSPTREQVIELAIMYTLKNKTPKQIFQLLAETLEEIGQSSHNLSKALN